MNKSLKYIFLLVFCLNSLNTYAIEEILPYDYSSTYSVKIELMPLEKIDSGDSEIYEGKIVKFKVKEDVIVQNHKILPKGTIATGRIGNIMSNGFNGIPAEILIDDFNIPGIKNSKLVYNSKIVGHDHLYWLLPVRAALMPIPFSNIFTYFIKGGEAKLRTNERLILYYYPDWK